MLPVCSDRCFIAEFLCQIAASTSMLSLTEHKNIVVKKVMEWALYVCLSLETGLQGKNETEYIVIQC